MKVNTEQIMAVEVHKKGEANFWDKHKSPGMGRSKVLSLVPDHISWKAQSRFASRLESDFGDRVRNHSSKAT